MVEKHIIEFLCKLVGFKEVDGLFCPGGSMANCYSMILARQQIYPDAKEMGIFGKKRLIVYVSDQAHYSFCKMSIIMGQGLESIVAVKTDDMGRMIPGELEKCIQDSLKNGFVPCMVAATVGTTVFGCFDPIEDLMAVARRYKIWFHVDGAFGGAWVFSKKYRHFLKGLEQADSFTWDLHKTSSLPIYCSVILVNRSNVLIQTFSLNAEYLFQTRKYYDKSYDPGDKSFQCTRKVEAYKLFVFLKAHGLNEMARIVDNVYEMAR